MSPEVLVREVYQVSSSSIHELNITMMGLGARTVSQYSARYFSASSCDSSLAVDYQPGHLFESWVPSIHVIMPDCRCSVSLTPTTPMDTHPSTKFEVAHIPHITSVVSAKTPWELQLHVPHGTDGARFPVFSGRRENYRLGKLARSTRP